MELFTFYYVRTFTLQSNFHTEHAEIFVFIRATQSCQPQIHATGILEVKVQWQQFTGFSPYRMLRDTLLHKAMLHKTMLHKTMLQVSFQRSYGQIRITSPTVKAIKIAATSAGNLFPQVMRN